MLLESLNIGIPLSKLKISQCFGYKPSYKIRGVVALSTPGGQESNISSIFPHSPRFSLIFPQLFSIFFLNLGLRVGGSPTREGPGYATVQDFFLPRFPIFIRLMQDANKWYWLYNTEWLPVVFIFESYWCITVMQAQIMWIGATLILVASHIWPQIMNSSINHNMIKQGDYFHLPWIKFYTKILKGHWASITSILF